MQYHADITEAAYADLLIRLISGFEGHEVRVRDTGDRRATIGYGYTFNRANNVATWTAAGIALSTSELAALAAIDAALPANRTALAIATFPRSMTREEAIALLGQTYPQYEGPANVLGMPISLERAAFVSLTYNRGVGAARSMTAFASALQASDRAEAWFQLRYKSLGTVDQFVEGKAKRRFVEAQVFGIYDNVAAVGAAEASRFLRC